VLDGTEPSELDYHVSSFSGGGNCVAVARLSSGDYLVRHSRDGLPPMRFSRDEWVAFVAGVKAAEFDF
jgi:Domain of unknown function (DUF397)